MPTLVLASASPRRKLLLEMLGIPIVVMPADIQEIPLPGEPPLNYSRRLSRDKARSIPGELVLGADTIVLLGDEIIEKPTDDDHALAMLTRLQGQTHEVLSSVCLIAGGVERYGHTLTRVTFAPASEAILRAYISTGEPRDKAGAYGIQGFGAALVERIEGDYFGVMGLPVRKVVELLGEAGWEYWKLR